MTTRQDAVAALAEDVGKALIAFAERLREEPTRAAGRVRAATPGRQLGRSQELVLDVVRQSGAQGLTAGEVAEQTELKPTNTPRILRALEERGLVTGSDEKPTVWRTVDDGQ